MHSIPNLRRFVLIGGSEFLDNVDFPSLSSEESTALFYHITDLAAGLKPEEIDKKDRAKFVLDEMSFKRERIEQLFYQATFYPDQPLEIDFLEDNSIRADVRFFWNFYFRTVNNKSPKTETTKPKRLFQYWDKNPPEDIIEQTGRWEKAVGKENYHRFNDEEAREAVLAAIGPTGAETYDNCWHPAMKSDFFRYVEIYERGGTYMDADMQLVDGAIDYFKTCNQETHFWLATNTQGGAYHNSVMSAQPKARVFEICIESCIANIKRAGDAKVNPIANTGPGVLKNSIESHYKNSGEVNASSAGAYEGGNYCAVAFGTSYRNDDRSWQKAVGWR